MTQDVFEKVSLYPGRFKIDLNATDWNGQHQVSFEDTELKIKTTGSTLQDCFNEYNLKVGKEFKRLSKLEESLDTVASYFRNE